MEEEREVSCEYVYTPVVIHSAHHIVVCMCVHARFLLSVLCTDTHKHHHLCQAPISLFSVTIGYVEIRDIGTCFNPEIRGSMVDDKQFPSSIGFLVHVIYQEDHSLQLDIA
jgi:hypothetical protein